MLTLRRINLFFMFFVVGCAPSQPYIPIFDGRDWERIEVVENKNVLFEGGDWEAIERQKEKNKKATQFAQLIANIIAGSNGSVIVASVEPGDIRNIPKVPNLQLSGLVTNENIKLKIEEKIKEKIKDVKITNEIVIGPVSISDRNNFINRENLFDREAAVDRVISERVKNAIKIANLPVEKIDLFVQNRVLYLYGKVTYGEGNAAAEAARKNSDDMVIKIVKLFEYIDHEHPLREKNEKEKNIANIFVLAIENTLPNSYGDFTLKIQANSSVSSLKINDQEQGGSADGRYAITRIVRAGHTNTYKIVATDRNGNTDIKTITVSRPVAESKPFVEALNPAQVRKQPERDAVAVIIGIAEYKNLPRADFANDDARVFYDYAIRALGVKPENIKLLVDADADDVAIYRAFKTWLPGRVRSSTDVYVYYSGHGLPTADGKGLYLLPQRADRDFIDKTAITQSEINVAIQAAKPRSVTVFLDSCYSGQARSGETLIASARPVALKTEKQLFPDNFTVITASQADQISSSSPDLKHGIFSYYLMRGMEGDADANRDGKITAGEMQAYLLEQVPRQAGMQNRVQHPQLIGDANRVLVGR